MVCWSLWPWWFTSSFRFGEVMSSAMFVWMENVYDGPSKDVRSRDRRDPWWVYVGTSIASRKNGTVRNPTWFGVPLTPLVNYCVIFRISYEMTILGIYRCIPFSDRPKWSNEVRAYCISVKTNAAGTSIKSSARLNLKTCRSTEFCVWPILSILFFFCTAMALCQLITSYHRYNFIDIIS